MLADRAVRHLCQAVLWLLNLLCLPGLAVASLPEWPAPRWLHTGWTAREGAPADIWALTRDGQGVLWLGTGSGLYQFDGLHFTAVLPPAGQGLASRDITALLAAADGTLWMGFQQGGVSRRDRQGQWRHYQPAQGAPPGMVLALAQDGRGRIWAGGRKGLRWFDGQVWHTPDPAWQLPQLRADALLRDRAGSLWLADGERLRRLPAHADRFEVTAWRVAPLAALALAPDGAVWLSDQISGLRRIVNPDIAPAAETASPPAHLAQFGFDLDGQLWGTDRHQGGALRVGALERFTAGAAVSAKQIEARYGVTAGLSSSHAIPLLADHEGNIWIGTNLGLHRFRRAQIAVFDDARLKSRMSYGLTMVAGDGVYISTPEVLLQVRGDRLSTRLVTPARSAYGVLPAPDGGLWLHNPSGLSLLPVGAQKPQRIAALDGTGPAWTVLAGTADGAVLGMPPAGGLYRVHEGRVQQLAASTTVPGGATVLLQSAGGTVWIGYAGGVLRRWEPEQPALPAVAVLDGRSVELGAITALLDSGAGLLVAGEAGLALWQSGRARLLRAPEPVWLTGISGMVIDADGGLWANGLRGLLRLNQAQFAALLDTGAEPHWQLFDAADGLPGVALQWGPNGSALRDHEGRLWFATNQGPAVVDPARLHPPAAAPLVSLRDVRSGGQIWPLPPTGGVLELPALTRELRIDYTAWHLAAPERVRFQHRLEGVDRDWQDAGIRRQAFYANLGPGQYRFEVRAAQADGVFGSRTAGLAVTIAPALHQTGWFVAAAICGGLALTFFWVRRRLRQRDMHIHLRVEERHLERERIARELHDTLLQSVQGLVLRFQAVANRLPRTDPVRGALEQALDRADAVVAEGQARVRDLRRGTLSTQDLPGLFALAATELSAGESTADFQVQVDGVLPALPGCVCDEIYRIGREWLANACRHAGATAIRVTLAGTPQRLLLRVADNGVGFDPQSGERVPGRPGGWGLAGVRERARAIGAQQRVQSAPGRGTVAELLLLVQPARQSWWRRHLGSRRSLDGR